MVGDGMSHFFASQVGLKDAELVDEVDGHVSVLKGLTGGKGGVVENTRSLAISGTRHRG